MTIKGAMRVLALLAISFGLQANIFQCIESARHLGESRFVPYDANRVRLNSGDFINASYLIDNGHSFIVAETPSLEKTGAFWEMIRQENVRVFVSLDMNAWPHKGEKELYGDLAVSCIDERTESLSPFENITQRYFVLSNGEEKRGVIQLELEQGGRITFVSKNVLRSLAERAERLNTKAPVIVHSETGVGLTGAFIAAGAREERNLDLIARQRYDLFHGQSIR